MIYLLDIQWPELEKLLFGEQHRFFFIEILLRTVVMYFVLLFGIRLMGKRGVRQLSIFELVVIIGLGSAAGDPMFYEEVGLVSAIAVFFVVIGAYRATTWLTAKSSKFEVLVEGTTVCVIEKGRFCIDSFHKEDLAQDEFFSELRLKGVSQLGQVDRAYLEISGELSVFFFEDGAVKSGLPILPHLFSEQHVAVPVSALYACAHCGETTQIESGAQPECPVCHRQQWVAATNARRIT